MTGELGRAVSEVTGGGALSLGWAASTLAASLPASAMGCLIAACTTSSGSSAAADDGAVL